MSTPETQQILHAENFFFLINGFYGRHPKESQTQREDKLKGWVGKGEGRNFGEEKYNFYCLWCKSDFLPKCPYPSKNHWNEWEIFECRKVIGFASTKLLGWLKTLSPLVDPDS